MDTILRVAILLAALSVPPCNTGLCAVEIAGQDIRVSVNQDLTLKVLNNAGHCLWDGQHTVAPRVVIRGGDGKIRELPMASAADQSVSPFAEGPYQGYVIRLNSFADSDAVLELRDAKGRTALFKRRQKVRFLQDGVTSYQYEAWGDGDPFASLKCSPGVVADRYRHGHRHVVLISLRETKNRGDVTELNLERTIRGGFTEASEWFQTELNFKTHRVRVAVVFPRNRPFRRAILIQRSRGRSQVLGESNLSRLPDGRQVLAWERRNPPVGELFTLKWDW